MADLLYMAFLFGASLRSTVDLALHGRQSQGFRDAHRSLLVSSINIIYIRWMGLDHSPSSWSRSSIPHSLSRLSLSAWALASSIASPTWVSLRNPFDAPFIPKILTSGASSNSLGVKTLFFVNVSYILFRSFLHFLHSNRRWLTDSLGAEHHWQVSVSCTPILRKYVPM